MYLRTGAVCAILVVCIVYWVVSTSDCNIRAILLMAEFIRCWWDYVSWFVFHLFPLSVFLDFVGQILKTIWPFCIIFNSVRFSQFLLAECGNLLVGFYVYFIHFLQCGMTRGSGWEGMGSFGCLHYILSCWIWRRINIGEGVRNRLPRLPIYILIVLEPTSDLY
jgi:hypothetical protein